MANRNIDESIRKPRRTKGTPFYRQRNYIAIGAIIFGGISWFLFEQWSETKKLKKSIAEGKFKYSPELQEHIFSMQLGNKDPALVGVMSKLRERRQERDKLAKEGGTDVQYYAEEPRMQPWFSKAFSGGGGKDD